MNQSTISLKNKKFYRFKLSRLVLCIMVYCFSNTSYALPDLVVTYASVVGTACQGNSNVIKVRIRNNNSDPSGQFNLSISRIVGDPVVDISRNISELQGGGAMTLFFRQVDLSEIGEGVGGNIPTRPYISVRIDGGSAVEESNENNNSINVGLNIIAQCPDKPDVAVTSIKWSNSVCEKGKIDINVGVQKMNRVPWTNTNNISQLTLYTYLRPVGDNNAIDGTFSSIVLPPETTPGAKWARRIPVEISLTNVSAGEFEFVASVGPAGEEDQSTIADNDAFQPVTVLDCGV